MPTPQRKVYRRLVFPGKSLWTYPGRPGVFLISSISPGLSHTNRNKRHNKSEFLANQCLEGKYIVD